MSKRYYLSPIVGTGIRGAVVRARAQDRYREVCSRVGAAALRASPAQFSALIPTLPNGAPRETWTLCTIDLPDFTELDADAALALLTRQSLLDTAPTAATDTALAKFGLVRNGGDATLTAVVRRTLRLLESTAEVR